MCPRVWGRTQAWICAGLKWPSLSRNKKPARSRLYLSGPEVSPGSAFSSPSWNCSLTQTAPPQFLSCLLVPRFSAKPSWMHNFTGQFPAANCLQDPSSRLQASPTAGLVAQTPNQDPETWVFWGGGHSQRKFFTRKRAKWMFVHLANGWNEATAVQMGPCILSLNPLPYYSIARSTTRLEHWEDQWWQRDFCGYKDHCWIVNSLWKLYCHKSGSEINEINSKARSE